MGMASTQVRLCALLTEKSNGQRKLMSITLQKNALAREASKLSEDYYSALNSKVLKWTNNSGVTYSDVSYSAMMYPSTLNANTPYLITDRNGKVVVDSKYKEYAQMISQDGSPNPKAWETNRYSILSQLTGVDEQTIRDAEEATETRYTQIDVLEDLKATEPEITDKEYSGVVKDGTENNLLTLLGKAGISVNVGKWDKDLSASEYTKVLEELRDNLQQYFLDSDQEKFIKACNTMISAGQGDTKTYNDILACLMSTYAGFGGTVVENTNKNSDGSGKWVDYFPQWYDTSNSKYQEYLDDHAIWQAKYDAAEQTYEDAIATHSEAYTADTESKINFYDTMFSTIAEQGWAYYESCNDTDYLNQMFQNNMFMITTVDRDFVCTDKTNHEYSYENTYNTDLASNCSKFVYVNDDELQEKKQVEYEAKKSRIQEKESRLDTRSKTIQTDIEAVKTMIESYEQIIKKNTENSFSTFT